MKNTKLNKFAKETIIHFGAFALVFSTSIGFAAPAPASKAIELLTKGGKVEFLAIGSPGFLKCRGKGAEPKGKVAIKDGKANGEISFDLKSLDTEIEKRNEHMRDKYLEVAKFPTAILRLKDVPVSQLPESGKTQELKLEGELELHGVKRSLPVGVKLNGTKATSEFKLKLSEYEIAIPNWLGVTVADEVTVTVETELLAQSDAAPGGK